MTLRIATPYPAVSLTITQTKLGNLQSPMIQIILKMTKAATVPLSARIIIELKDAEMRLS